MVGGTRSGRVSTTSNTGVSTLFLASANQSSGSISVAGSGGGAGGVVHVDSDGDLLTHALTMLNPGTGTVERYRRSSQHLLDSSSVRSSTTPTSATMGRSRRREGTAGQGLLGTLSSGQLSHGISAYSLTSMTTEAPTPSPGVTTNVISSPLPSIYLGSDASIYELLFELAESELIPTTTTVAANTSQSAGKSDRKRSHMSGMERNASDPPTEETTGGTKHNTIPQFSQSFSLLHPIRLLLASLPTFRPKSMSRQEVELHHSLFCSPTSLTASTPFRTLYKLQVCSLIFFEQQHHDPAFLFTFRNGIPMSPPHRYSVLT